MTVCVYVYSTVRASNARELVSFLCDPILGASLAFSNNKKKAMGTHKRISFSLATLVKSDRLGERKMGWHTWHTCQEKINRTK